MIYQGLQFIDVGQAPVIINQLKTRFHNKLAIVAQPSASVI